MKFLIFAITASMFLSSCFSTGHNFPSRIDWIQKDKTDQKDVQLVLGKPFSVGNSGGTKTWTYAFYHYKLGAHSFYKELRFYWNSNNTVKHFSFNSSFPSDLRAIENNSSASKLSVQKP